MTSWFVGCLIWKRGHGTRFMLKESEIRAAIRDRCESGLCHLWWFIGTRSVRDADGSHWCIQWLTKKQGHLIIFCIIPIKLSGWKGFLRLYGLAPLALAWFIAGSRYCRGTRSDSCRSEQPNPTLRAKFNLTERNAWRCNGRNSDSGTSWGYSKLVSRSTLQFNWAKIEASTTLPQPRMRLISGPNRS